MLDRGTCVILTGFNGAVAGRAVVVLFVMIILLVLDAVVSLVIHSLSISQLVTDHVEVRLQSI